MAMISSGASHSSTPISNEPVNEKDKTPPTSSDALPLGASQKEKGAGYAGLMRGAGTRFQKFVQKNLMKLGTGGKNALMPGKKGTNDEVPPAAVLKEPISATPTSKNTSLFASKTSANRARLQKEFEKSKKENANLLKSVENRNEVFKSFISIFKSKTDAVPRVTTSKESVKATSTSKGTPSPGATPKGKGDGSAGNNKTQGYLDRLFTKNWTNKGNKSKNSNTEVGETGNKLPAPAPAPAPALSPQSSSKPQEPSVVMGDTPPLDSSKDTPLIGNQSENSEPPVKGWATFEDNESPVKGWATFEDNEPPVKGGNPFEDNEPPVKGGNPFEDNEPPVKGGNPFEDNEPPVKGGNPFEDNESPVKGSNPFEDNESPVKGSNPFEDNESPVKGWATFEDNEPPIKGSNPFEDNEPPVKGSNPFEDNESPVKGWATFEDNEPPLPTEVNVSNPGKERQTGLQTEETTFPSSQSTDGKSVGGQDTGTLSVEETPESPPLKTTEQLEDGEIGELENPVKLLEEANGLLGHPVTSMEGARRGLFEKAHEAVSKGKKLSTNFIERADNLVSDLDFCLIESAKSGVELHSPLTKRLIDDANIPGGLNKEILEKSFDFGTASPVGNNCLLDTLKTLSEKLNFTPPDTMDVRGRLEAAGLAGKDETLYGSGITGDAIARQYGVRFTLISQTKEASFTVSLPVGKAGDPEVYVRLMNPGENGHFTPLFPKPPSAVSNQSLSKPEVSPFETGGIPPLEFPDGSSGGENSKKTTGYSEPSLRGKRALLRRQNGKGINVPAQQDSGISNEEEVKLFTDDKVDYTKPWKLPDEIIPDGQVNYPLFSKDKEALEFFAKDAKKIYAEWAKEPEPEKENPIKQGGKSFGLPNDKETNVPPQQDSNVPNQDAFALFTAEQMTNLFEIWKSIPAEQKAEAEQKFDQLKTSMVACKSDDERKTVFQNAIASMQELVSQMPAASQPDMREKLSKLSNSLGGIKNAPVKGDEKPDVTSDVDGDKKPTPTSGVNDDKKPGATSKSGGNEGPEKKDPSSEFPSFSDMKNMSKEELLEQQQRQSWEAMMIQIVLTNMQILTEIVKKGTGIAAGAIQ